MTIKTAEEKLILSVLNGDKQQPPPIWLMRQAGRHLPEYMELRSKSESFLDFCYTPSLCVEATLQPINRYGFDAAILFSDILVIPDALGQQVNFISGTGPVLEPIMTADEIKKLSVGPLYKKLSPIYESIVTVSEKLKTFPNKPALIGFSGAPWTLATYMVEGGSSKDYQTIKKWAYKSPGEFSQLIDILIDAIAEHLLNQINSGVEVIQLFDSWAGVLSPLQFDLWVIEPTKKIINKLKTEYPSIPIIGFPRGAGLLYERFIRLTGVDAISIDSTIPLSWAIKHINKNIIIQGNLDNISLMMGGNLMEDEVNNILSCLSDRPFIFNLGHGVLPETPISHVERLIELVRRKK
jgi:uroporphyrinogen decarboxylase